MKLSYVGVDLPKNVYQLHGVSTERRSGNDGYDEVSGCWR